MPYLDIIIIHFCNFILKRLIHYDLSGKVIIRIFDDVKVRYFSGLSFEQILFKGYEKHPSYVPKKGDIVVDIGAFVGLYSLKAAKLGALVIAIEPNPISFIQLYENIKLNNFSNIIPINIALSDHEGLGYLNIIENHVPSPLAHISHANTLNVVRVELKTLDMLIETLGLSWIDIVKIDVEGHEVQVLNGGKNSLKKKLINKLIIEIHTPIKVRLPTIIRLLKSYGYKIDGIFEGVLYARA
jgi:FkbM family methyltransferase